MIIIDESFLINIFQVQFSQNSPGAEVRNMKIQNIYGDWGVAGPFNGDMKIIDNEITAIVPIYVQVTSTIENNNLTFTSNIQTTYFYINYFILF